MTICLDVCSVRSVRQSRIVHPSESTFFLVLLFVSLWFIDAWILSDGRNKGDENFVSSAVREYLLATGGFQQKIVAIGYMHWGEVESEYSSLTPNSLKTVYLLPVLYYHAFPWPQFCNSCSSLLVTCTLEDKPKPRRHCCFLFLLSHAKTKTSINKACGRGWNIAECRTVDIFQYGGYE